MLMINFIKHFIYRKRGIPWSNLVSFNSDNCSAMKGHRNGVIAKLREKVPGVIDIGCICHLANLAVGQALKVSPIDCDSLICDINTHFSLRLV